MEQPAKKKKWSELLFLLCILFTAFVDVLELQASFHKPSA